MLSPGLTGDLLLPPWHLWPLSHKCSLLGHCAGGLGKSGCPALDSQQMRWKKKGHGVQGQILTEIKEIFPLTVQKTLCSLNRSGVFDSVSL